MLSFTASRVQILTWAAAVVALGVLAGPFAAAARAELVITEVMNSSAHAGAANGDWFELTNTGPSSVDLENYYWDDDGPLGNDGALFPAITIGAGQSIVIVDEGADNLAAFVAAWGGGFTAYSKDDFGGPDDFSGLSSAGDEINLWDADPNAGPANQVAYVDFGECITCGASFEWDASGNSLGMSVAGENGAFVATNDGEGGVSVEVASPGFAVGAAVPEPSTWTLLLLGAALLALGGRKLQRA